ncbi:unnamed protein product [Absidia cylindrospora]
MLTNVFRLKKGCRGTLNTTDYDRERTSFFSIGLTPDSSNSISSLHACYAHLNIMENRYFYQ